jgi:hypothetical protein
MLTLILAPCHFLVNLKEPHPNNLLRNVNEITSPTIYNHPKRLPLKGRGTPLFTKEDIYEVISYSFLKK